jgi:phosphoribosyl 1,2-cyclic phosphate phosphodiesterase
MGFNTVIEVRNRLMDMGLVDDKSICVANHFSHNVGPLYEDMRAASEKENMLTSYDGMVVEF